MDEAYIGDVKFTKLLGYGVDGVVWLVEIGEVNPSQGPTAEPRANSVPRGPISVMEWRHRFHLVSIFRQQDIRVVRRPLNSSSLRLGSNDGVVSKVAEALTFQYSTKSPDANNWIGIWDPLSGPNDGAPTASAAWAYAADAQGTTQLRVSDVKAGMYKAYFLSKNDNRLLAPPIDVFVPGPGPMAFAVDGITTHNARQGDAFVARIDGLLLSRNDSDVIFSKAYGHDWVHVSSDGVISGNPSHAGDTHVTIVASTPDHRFPASLSVTIPVRQAGARLVEKLCVMSFNLWVGGTFINDYARKQARFLAESNCDVIGLQETRGFHAKRIAHMMGYHVLQGRDAGILSRYPIVEAMPAAEAGVGARIQLDGADSQVIAWSAHLAYQVYGPYSLCYQGKSARSVVDDENKAEVGRGRQIRQMLDLMAPQMVNASKVPVLLTGDFNAPSHLDYTPATSGMNCGAGPVEWPTSVEPVKAGLVDSFRAVHPDAAAEPGITWSPINRFNNEYGKPEPQDRIDFIYHKGLEVLHSTTAMVGNPQRNPGSADNEWTTDHKAVVSFFRVPFHQQAA
ncbi:hypothetical protein L249_3823 [Ophiocordyceps polyrhachis-furcata BCC 54312]|uniref:Endonuclease/exonuclease/phosphatase domain-containing protein n=1 Tax=Ophiocordyceps polyrhachis-furcata BCC 54312 TaxID=1330021 RepID=A0A367L5H5_9HYPO|nr:hypothetical protein L249_3823 [Ophiocordyceps polyrhachis-furcata BCC 54312]